MLVRFCCILAFFCLAILVNGQDKGFLATFPTSVIPGTSAKFCIRFFNVGNDVTINIHDEEPHLFEEIREVVSTSIVDAFMF